MPKQCDCPGRAVYDHGYGKRVETWQPTEQEAIDALNALLPIAKADALKAQDTAFEAALRAGDAACKQGKPPCAKCDAWFRKPDLGPPWTAVGSVAPYKRWLARGGYEWTIEVKCECEEEKPQPN